MLLDFVGTITTGAYRVTDEQVQGLREVGWSDEQIAGTNEFEQDGSNTPTDWIRINCRMTGPAAANSIAVGNNLGQLEKSTVGAMRGELGYAHMVVLARTAEATGDAFNERDLLEKALENSPGKLHYLCRHYRHARNPKAHAEEEADLHEQRFLKIGTCPHGGISVSGFLGPVARQPPRSALEPPAPEGRAAPEPGRAPRTVHAPLEAV